MANLNVVIKFQDLNNNQYDRVITYFGDISAAVGS